jgi:hypothetical protein
MRVRCPFKQRKRLFAKSDWAVLWFLLSFRLDSPGFGKMSIGLFLPPLAGEEVSQVVMGLGILRVDSQGLRVMGDGLLLPPLESQKVP